MNHEIKTKSLLDWLTLLAGKFPDETALFDQDLKEEWRFSGLLERIKQIGADLETAGLAHGQCVMIALPDGPEALIYLMATASYATAIPVPPHESESFYEGIFEQLGVSAVIMKERPYAVLTQICEKKGTAVFIPNQDGVVLSMGQVITTPRESDWVDISIISHTSGSVNQPNLLGFSAEIFIDNIENFAKLAGFTRKDRLLCMMPITHMHSLWRSSIAVWSVGGSVCWTSGFELPAASRWLDSVRPTFFSLTSTFHRQLIAFTNKEKYQAPDSLRMVGIGSEKVDSQLLADIHHKLRAQTLHFYGMSQTCPVVATSEPDRPDVNQVKLRINPLWELRIADEDGKPLAAGENGEILLKGGSYSKVLGGRVSEFTTDGYFRTGDTGIVGTDGYLTVSGRLDDRITRGGDKINPADIEREALVLNEVSEAYAFAVPDEVHGQKTAVVVRGESTLAVEQLRSTFVNRLRSYMVPDYIVVETGELPRNRVGKISRKLLAEFYSDKFTHIQSEAPSEAESIPCLDPAEMRIIEELFEQSLEGEPITQNSNYFDLGGNSLSAVSLLIDLEEKFGLAVPPAVFSASPTPLGVARFIKQHRIGTVRDVGRVTIVQQGTTGIALCVAPGLFGGNFGIIAGNSRLSTKHTLVTIQGYSDASAPKEWKNFFDLANAVIPEIATKLHGMKLIFTGYSLGAHIAVHMAKIAMSKGLEVSGVVVLDDAADLEMRQYGAVSHSIGPEAKDYQRWLLKTSPVPPLEANVIYFRATEPPVEVLSDPLGGWQEVCAGKIIVQSIEGEHEEIIKADGIRAINASLDDLIDQMLQLPTPGPLDPIVNKRFEMRLAGRQGRQEDELALAREILADQGEKPFWLHSYLIRMFGSIGDMTKADFHFRQALCMDAFPLSTYELSLSFLKEKEMKKAKRDYIRFLNEIPSDQFSVALAMGEYYQHKKRFFLAGLYFHKSARLDPESARAKNLLKLMMEQDARLISFAQWLDIRPARKPFWFHLLCLLLRPDLILLLRYPKVSRAWTDFLRVRANRS